MASKTANNQRARYEQNKKPSDRGSVKNSGGEKSPSSEEQYHFMVENAPAVIWKTAYNSFDFLYVSPEAERIFGYSQQECLQKGFLEKLIHPEEKDWVLEYCRLATKERHPYQLEYRILTKSGKERKVRESIRIIYKLGKPYQKIGLTFDVSIQSQTLEELQLSNQKFYRAFHSFPVPAVITRLKDSRIMDVNKNFLQVSGYRRNEIVGKSPFELDSWVDSLERDKIISLLRAKEKVDKYPIQLKDGYSRIRNVLVSAELFENNKELHLLLMLNDITDQIKTEERLKQTNRELETFMYKSSHNLKGPVASIKGLLYLAGLEEEHNPAAKQYLELINKSVKGLERTLEELMDIARLKQGRLKIEAVDLEYVVTEIINKLKFMPEWKGISYAISVQQESAFYTDLSLLQSILQNLVENAVKYKKENQQSWVKIEGKVSSREAEISVEDNGLGIPREQQERVFEMFYRAHQTASGTGLGLYIVRNSVEKLGGEIHLSSKRNEGSRFMLNLPNISSGLKARSPEGSEKQG